MIATVTMNPAVDYTVQLEEPLQFNAVNRTENEQITAGGKGINVSLILQQLEIPTTVYGYLSGTTGTMISERIQRTQIPMDFITLPNQMNRINVKFKGSGFVENQSVKPGTKIADIKELTVELK